MSTPVAAPTVAVRFRVLALRAALLSPFALVLVGVWLAVSPGWGLASAGFLAWFDGSVLAVRGAKR